MKNEPAFKVGEEVYYVDLDGNEHKVFTCVIKAINKRCEPPDYSLYRAGCGYAYNVPERNIFKKSFIEKLNLVFAEKVDKLKNKE